MKLKFSKNRNYDIEVYSDKNFSDIVKSFTVVGDYGNFSKFLSCLERVFEYEVFNSIKLVDDRGYFFYYRKLGDTWKRVYPPFPVTYCRLVFSSKS